MSLTWFPKATYCLFKNALGQVRASAGYRGLAESRKGSGRERRQRRNPRTKHRGHRSVEQSSPAEDSPMGDSSRREVKRTSCVESQPSVLQSCGLRTEWFQAIRPPFPGHRMGTRGTLGHSAAMAGKLSSSLSDGLSEDPVFIKTPTRTPHLWVRPSSFRHELLEAMAFNSMNDDF